MSGWGGCLDGQDVLASVRENSPSGEMVVELMTHDAMEGVHWSLDGKDADWFLWDGRSIRLNTSAERVLDREVFPDPGAWESLSSSDGNYSLHSDRMSSCKNSDGTLSLRMKHGLLSPASRSLSYVEAAVKGQRLSVSDVLSP